MKLDIFLHASWPEDIHPEDIAGVVEDIDDVCRFQGGHAVLEVKVNDQEWRPAA